MPSSGDLPDPGIEPAYLMSPDLAGMFFTTSATWEAPWPLCLPLNPPLCLVVLFRPEHHWLDSASPLASPRSQCNLGIPLSSLGTH